MVCVPATDFARLPVSGLVHPEAQCDLLFVGSRSDANIAGITWFLRECFPRIAAALPRVRLRIHGTITEMPDLTQLVARLQNGANVAMSGPSESMDDVYASARAVICPIRHGTGMKIKLIEAMAHGKAIVATSKAAEGIATDLGLEFFDAPEDFAEACVRVLDDADLRERSERNALATFTRDHEHAQAAARLASVLGELRIS
jgi:glycosyltransferase involved in cell wall biosynthesis